MESQGRDDCPVFGLSNWVDRAVNNRVRGQQRSRLGKIRDCTLDIFEMLI